MKYAVSLVILFLTRLAFADAPATQPATQPTISPDAAALLTQIHDAYAAAGALSVNGTFTADFDIDGRKTNSHADFSGNVHGQLFRSEAKGDVVIGNSGDRVYLYQPQENTYTLSTPPTGAGILGGLDARVANILNLQNPSLALALSGDAAKQLSQDATSIARGDDLTIDGVKYPTLQIRQSLGDTTIAVDPKTHLMRRATIDLSSLAEHDGAAKVNTALFTIDYSTTTAAPVDDTLFSWSPPPGAQESQAVAGMGADSSALTGKPAPSFKLPGLDDKIVSDTDMRGTVYILDFWATWCGPCRESLPGLDQIYQDLGSKGLKVFAVNLQEDKDTVAKFVQETKLTIPPLLDTDGKIAQEYGANAIPQTVVIGRNGNVLAVFVGGGHEDEIRAMALQALSQP